MGVYLGHKYTSVVTAKNCRVMGLKKNAFLLFACVRTDCGDFRFFVPTIRRTPVAENDFFHVLHALGCM